MVRFDPIVWYRRVVARRAPRLRHLGPPRPWVVAPPLAHVELLDQANADVSRERHSELRSGGLSSITGHARGCGAPSR
jgi:hypothetical protein